VKESEAIRLFSQARVARLATVSADGAPHLVPITFALLDERTLVTVVDRKPKRTTALKRLANIAANPRVTVLADHYGEDWGSLWWVRADGEAVSSVPSRAALLALADRYPQYRQYPPPGPMIVITVQRWVGWQP
jgi:PPOX class probable F420-dependent enzyme